MIAFCMVLLFEGITNWRIPSLISKIRFGHLSKNDNQTTLGSDSIIGNIEAERMMRFMIVMFLAVSFFTFPDILWFFPWYVAGMMIVAGITNICPMVMFLRWVGFR